MPVCSTGVIMKRKRNKAPAIPTASPNCWGLEGVRSWDSSGKVTQRWGRGCRGLSLRQSAALLLENERLGIPGQPFCPHGPFRAQEAAGWQPRDKRGNAVTLSAVPLWDWTTQDHDGHKGSSDKNTSPPGTLQQGTDCFPSLQVSLPLIYTIFSFCYRNHPQCRHSLHLYSVPYLKSDCGGFHEQNLYCLGISAVYFGRDISIYISYTQSSIRSCIDFSLQAYIYIWWKIHSCLQKLSRH